MSRNDALLEAFAVELRSRRSQAGLSQEALALNAGVNRTFVGKLETARNQPTLTEFLKLAEALGVELPDLIGGAIARSRRASRAKKQRSRPPTRGLGRN